jgi:hypothetical protein
MRPNIQGEPSPSIGLDYDVAALNAKLQGLSRTDTAARAALISRTYRDGGGSGAIRTEAYALARMPMHRIGYGAG